jgi:subtilisin family serine protease
LVALPTLAAARVPAPSSKQLAEVVVELSEPSRARGGSPLRIAVEQQTAEQRILELVPGAQVRWRYRVVLNGLAVLVPEQAVKRLGAIHGVREVYPSVRFGPTLERSVPAIKAPGVWGPGLETSGQGIKIGILDDGLDQTHPFFNPAGYLMPPGYPKGQPAFTNAKVIVARSFPPPSPEARYAELPFNPEQSEHGTHVAGIAAGNPGTKASIGGGVVTLSGVAPRAYLGNYRVLTIPTISDVGLDGNSPEIAAGIEAAVTDGMDVINLSLGEPEISPGRDLVVRAIEGAAAAGVVPTIAAGNDFALFGQGSIASPGSSPSAITAGAATVAGRISGFSAAGPTPISLQLKPDVSAPGVSILSSIPARRGTWAGFSGTSMAAPHVAGAAALLTQRHPTWRVAQVKSALALTAHAASDSRGEAATTRQGAGFIDVTEADQPLLFAQPVSVSFGFLRAGRTATRRIALTDAGGGAGPWTVSIARQGNGGGVSVSAGSSISVPGTLTLRAAARSSAGEGDTTGFVVFSRSGKARRLPFWLRVTAPRLARQPARVLRRTGVYRGNTRGRRALVSVYRYPDNPSGVGLARRLHGPEQVFRVRVRRAVENIGVALLSRSRVQPRIVHGVDENHQAGSPALPLSINPYLPTFFDPAPVSSVIRPAAGTYSIVFDSPTRAGAGRFRFRFWLNDRAPPRVRLLTSSVRSRGSLLAAASDRGAGVDPRSVFVRIDGGSLRSASFRDGRVRVPLGSLGRGRHRLTLQVSDHQEAKNMENVPRILPNTTTLTTTFSVR